LHRFHAAHDNLAVGRNTLKGVTGFGLLSPDSGDGGKSSRNESSVQYITSFHAFSGFKK